MAVTRTAWQGRAVGRVAAGVLALLLVVVFPDGGRAGMAEPPEGLRDSSRDIEALEEQALQEAAAAANGPADSDVEWEPCYTAVGLGFQCATVDVPLQQGAEGPQIPIALLRLPAGDPESRIGSLLLNPGGPGGSGIEMLLALGPYADELWGPHVPARFDLVGFDPRGVGASDRLTCFDNQAEADPAFPPFAFPTTSEEIEVQQDADVYLATECGEEEDAVAMHMSTANVARDLDLLRAALGDELLSFVGYSYGSYLGVTYANLFPDRVRSVVVDAVIDPVAWANVEADIPNTTRLRSDEGSAETLARFFELCEEAGPQDCAFAPDAADRFAELVEEVRRRPIFDPTTGVQLSYADLVFGVRSILYDPYSYGQGAVALAAIENLAVTRAPADAGAVAAALAELERANPLVRMGGVFAAQDYFGREPFTAVLCEDGDNPEDYAAWPEAAAEADATYGVFGAPWTWASSACADWPLSDPDVYRGPWEATTANPVLVVSTEYDPATRLEGAQQVRALLPESALVTVDMPGHTTLGISACAGYLTGLYLLAPAVADQLDGFGCPPEFQPFLESSLPLGPGSTANVRRAALPEIAKVPAR